MLKKKSYQRPREILVETLREILVGAQILRLLHKNRNGNKRQGSQGRGQRGNKSKLKSYIKDVKNDVGETKGFWTRLPYGMCKENNLDASNAPGGSPRSSKKISSSNNSKDKKV